MKYYLEVVELKNDIVTASTCTDDCCDYGCADDFDQLEGNWF